MEPVTAIAVEQIIEPAAVEAIRDGIAEASAKALEQKSLTESFLNERTMYDIRHPLPQDYGPYGKMLNAVEAAKQDPEIRRALLNEIENGRNIKGQVGEYLYEKKLSTLGEVERQIDVTRDGATSGNVIDLKLTTHSNVKLTEIASVKGEITIMNNYEVVKGSTAAFEVKNGTLQYLEQKLASGELQNQIAAGAENADNSFVVINQDAANELFRSPDKAARILAQITEACGKLIVGLPGVESQQLIITEMIG